MPAAFLRLANRAVRAGVWLALLQAAGAQGQQAVPELPEPLTLRASPSLQEQLDGSQRGSLPSFVSGQHMQGRPDLETVLEGQAMLRRGDIVIQSDRLDYDQPTDLARAQGRVRVNRAGNVYEGPLLELRVDAFEGFFATPNYRFLRNEAHGQADRVEFVDEQRAVVYNATFTTCRRVPGPGWMPDWILKASSISMDNADDVGTARGALLSFKGVPLLPIPYLSFPLSEQRKSGLLPPTLGLNNVNGTEVSVPYYWNIAANRDATFTPTLMTKRGAKLDTEFRYLEADYTGVARLDWMPADKLREANRWGLNLNHQARLASGWSDSGMALNVNLNRVSDDNYWRDFTATNPFVSQRLLPNDATLSWHNGGWANTVRTLKWQTLQDVSAPITPPFDRLPQLSTTYVGVDDNGFDYSLTADYTRFQSDPSRTRQSNGERVFTRLQLAYPLIAAAGFLKPKLQWHATQYLLESPLANGATTASRTVPTFSLDAGLVFERDTEFWGRSVRQTLEPRAFYVNTPYRDQSLLPNYDSGAIDFNLATIFTENAFVGDDRISDSHLLTLGVTSRFLDMGSGAEAARIGVAQRLRLRDQNVTLPGALPAQDRISDLLLGGALRWSPRWSMDATLQFNPKTEQSMRSTYGIRYSPGSYRTISAAYRFQRDQSEQIDVGWQWPINDLWGDRGKNLGPGKGQGEGRWYSVGRLNYSMNEGKLVDSVLGFEYDADCWLGRIVFERLQTSSITATQRLMFQLEFVGFSRLGVNPLKSLKQNIPRYQLLREPGAAPSRFSNYD